MANMTRKQQDAINRAYSILEGHIDATNMSLPYALKQALKAERQACSALIWAKANVIESYVDGYGHPQLPISLAYSFRSGCLKALMLGAQCAREYKLDPERLEYLYTAIAVKKDAMTLRLAHV